MDLNSVQLYLNIIFDTTYILSLLSRTTLFSIDEVSIDCPNTWMSKYCRPNKTYLSWLYKSSRNPNK